MERNRSVASLQLVGGHHSLDLANTVASRGDPPGPDLLATYGDLLDWSSRTALLETEHVARLRQLAAVSPAAAGAGLERTRTLREAIYLLFSAVAAGADPDLADLDLLGREAAQAQAGRRLSRLSTSYAWQWSDDDLDAAARRIALSAAELLTGPKITQVKECPGRNCGWLFLDATRNGRRRWCSDRDCGGPARVRSHRSMKRQRASKEPESRES